MTESGHYGDFDILVHRNAGQYMARVVRSPVGEVYVELSGETIRAIRSSYLARHSPAGNLPNRSAAEFGAQLFDWLFPARIEQAYRRSLDRTENGRGLRIRLRMTEVPELASLPWECMYDRSHQTFLSLSRRTPIIRQLDFLGPVTQIERTRPLRIVVMLSNPTDATPALDTEREWQILTAALDDLQRTGSVVLDRLPDGTIRALQEHLLQAPAHIFHFVGHAGVDSADRQSYLLVEGEDGAGRAISADQLRSILADSPLRMAYLSACESAGAADPATANPFAGAAQSLIESGIPAVVAMQQTVTDDAAGGLADAFYHALAAGEPVESALTEARKALFAQDSPEWVSPVLYVRSSSEAGGDPFRLVHSALRDGPASVEQEYRPSILPDLPGHLFRQAQANRHRELALLETHLTENQLTTIVGIGGVGKTTLVRTLVECRDAEVPAPLWVNFAHDSAVTLDDLLEKCADYFLHPELLTYRHEERQPDGSDVLRLIEHLNRRRSHWIVLDNVESLLDADGRFRDHAIEDMAALLVTRAHPSRLIVTSRILPVFTRHRRLGNADRTPTLLLEGLETQAAVELLREELDSDAIDVLTELAERISGHPFGLHLIAQEAALWGLDELLSSQLLWQESIDGFADWLLARLTREEQRFLTQLTVLRKPHALAALLQLASDRQSGRRILTGLVNRALLQAYEMDGVKVYSLHPLVQELGANRMDAAATHAAHLAAYDLYRSFIPQPLTQEDTFSMREVFFEAFHHAICADAVDKAAAILFDYDIPEMLEHRGSQDRLIAMAGDLLKRTPQGESHAESLTVAGYRGFADETVDLSTRARRYRQLGRCAYYASDFSRALEAYEQGTALLPPGYDDRESARLHAGSAICYSWLGRPQEAIEKCNIGLQLLDHTDDREGRLILADLYMRLGNALAASHAHDSALAHFQQAYDLFQRIGLPTRAYQAYDNLGGEWREIGVDSGDEDAFVKARAIHEEAADYFQSVGSLQSVGTSMLNLAIVHYYLGDIEEASSAYQKALDSFHSIAYPRGIMVVRFNLGELALEEANPTLALEHLEDALRLSHEIGEYDFRPDILEFLVTANRQLGRNVRADEYQTLLVGRREDGEGKEQQ